MVFWSSFSKKIKQTVSQVAFDLLKKRVDKIETNYVDKTTNNAFRSSEKFQTISMQNKQNKDVLRFIVNTNYTYGTIDGGSGSGIYIKNVKDPTTPDNATNKGYVDGLYNPLNTKVESVIRGLQNGNIVNYEGVWNSSKTYHLAQAITYNGDWFVSTIDNNVGNTPNKNNTNYWVYISQPNVNLSDYITKNEATNLYISRNDASNLYITKTLLNTMFPIGSNVMTTNGSTHALVSMYPRSFKELSDSDIAYLAIGSGSSNSNTGTFTIQQNNLPNIFWSWYLSWNNGITTSETDLNAYTNNSSAYMTVSTHYTANNKKNSSGANNSGARAHVFTSIYLNGNTNQIPIQYTMKPKTLKIRMWEVIANLI